ncbi:MAG: hypothetical protein Q4C80_00450 [Bacillota bacterium]|nr:hypothetical protein [Bacillota bacterium]
MEKRHLIYNETLDYIEEQEKQGRVFVIRPEEKLQIGKVEKDPNKLREVYDIDREVATSQIVAIEKFINI